MSLAVGIAANLILDLALLSALAYVMSLPRRLTPHTHELGAPEIVIRRLTPREPTGEAHAVDPTHAVEIIGTAATDRQSRDVR
jgi:hypothetical protein